MLVNILPPSSVLLVAWTRVHNGASAANDTHIAIDFLSKLNIRFYAFNKIAPRKIQLPLQACGKLIKGARIIMQAMAVLSQRKGYSERFWNVMKTPGIFTWSSRVFASQIILIRALVITKQITEGWRENFFKGCKGVQIDHFKERILDLYSRWVTSYARQMQSFLLAGDFCFQVIYWHSLGFVLWADAGWWGSVAYCVSCMFNVVACAMLVSWHCWVGLLFALNWPWTTALLLFEVLILSKYKVIHTQTHESSHPHFFLS